MSSVTMPYEHNYTVLMLDIRPHILTSLENRVRGTSNGQVHIRELFMSVATVSFEVSTLRRKSQIVAALWLSGLCL